MNETIRIQMLSSFTLFSDLTTKELHEIANEFDDEFFHAGVNIINQYDTGDKLYFISKGTAEAYVINKHGAIVILSHLKAGDNFGELVLLIKGKRNCSVRATSECHLFSLKESKFKKLIKKYPSISIKLNTILSQRLSKTLHVVTEKKEDQIIALQYSPELQEKADYFEKYLHQIGSKHMISIDANITQSEFNNYLSSSKHRYVLIKTNREFPEFITQHAHHIIVLDIHTSDWQIGHMVRRITKKTIGIALCSGGAPSAAQIGVLQVLQEENIPLDYIVGCSAGALIGACFSLNYPLDQLKDNILLFINKNRLSRFFTIFPHLSFGLKGIIRNSYYRKAFTPLFGDKTFDDVSIPFAAIASDLLTGKTIILENGLIIDAVIASNTPALIMEPFMQDDLMLVDGMTTMPLPVQALINKKIDIKIAVPTPQLDLNVIFKTNSNLTQVLQRTISLMAENTAKNNAQLADVIIQPNVHGIYKNEWDKIHHIINQGRDATHIAINRIKQLYFMD